MLRRLRRVAFFFGVVFAVATTSFVFVGFVRPVTLSIAPHDLYAVRTTAGSIQIMRGWHSIDFRWDSKTPPPGYALDWLETGKHEHWFGDLLPPPDLNDLEPYRPGDSRLVVPMGDEWPPFGTNEYETFGESGVWIEGEGDATTVRGGVAMRSTNSRSGSAALVLAAIYLPLLVARFLRFSRRRPAGACVQCGYDLRATPGRCPECGAVPTVA